MPGIKIEVRGLKEIQLFLDDAGRLDDRVWGPLHRALNESVRQLEAQAKENVTANDSIASGQLRAGITGKVTMHPYELLGEVGAVAKGTNGYNYAPAVEYGTRPHWAPIEPLAEWVKLKGFAGDDRARRRIARAVQIKIARDGTRAQPFMEPAFDTKKHAIIRLFERAIDKIAANFGR